MDILARNLWERDWLDLWTVVHLFTGVCFGFCTFFYNSPYVQSFILFVLAIILWEVLEYYNQAKEPLSNQTTDVLSGALGFWATNKLIPLLTNDLTKQIIIFTIAYIVAWTFAYYGFQSFAVHFNRELEKYKNSFSGAILVYFVIMAGLVFLR